MTASDSSRAISADPIECLRDPECWRVGERVPDAVHLPSDAEEVAFILLQAARHGTRIVPAGRGGRVPVDADGTGEATVFQGCSSLPPAGPYDVLSTAALADVVEYEPADLTLTAGAGATLADLASRTAKVGQWLPADPPGVERMTLGSLLATGASGSLRAGFGRPRDHALGLTVVTGDGRIVQAGGRVVKNVAGFDLVRLFVGSRGRFGIITSATVRLFPLPAEDVSLHYELPSSEDAVAFARRLAALPLPIAALELLDPGPPHPPTVVARVLGSVRAVEEVVAALGRGGGWEEAGRRRGAEAADFFLGENRRAAAAPFVLALGFLPTRLAEVAGRIRALRKRVPEVGFFAHAMNGGARVILDEAALAAVPSDRWHAPMGEFRSAAISAGITARTVHAPPDYLLAVEEKARGRGVVVPEGEGGRPHVGVRRLEEGLKSAFDPAGVLP